MSEAWHQLDPAQVSERLGVDLKSGLTITEAAARLEAHGPNRLVEEAVTPWWVFFLAQFKDFMVLVLLGATAVSLALGEVADALTILAIVILNAVLGFIQEYRAEQSLSALKRLTAPTARCLRGGKQLIVNADELVPGDLLLLEAGDRVAADCRLLEAHSLEAEEAALTGESLPVKKQPEALPSGDTAVADRNNMLFMGTSLTRGRGSAVVVATGMQTQMGQIADLIQGVEEEPTPLQERLEQLGQWLVAAALIVCVVVVLTGLLRGEPGHRMFLTGVSLAVAAIPEGLPAIVTIGLALGMQRMIKRRAIVRKLQAVETLGCATVICSDKTGTLTKNEMMVRTVVTGGHRYTLTGAGYKPEGAFQRGGEVVSPRALPALAQTLTSGVLCSDARLVEEKGLFSVLGDPTEGALLVAAAKAGYNLGQVREGQRRLAEIPFEPIRRRMSVVVQGGAGPALHVKGAVGSLLPLCERIMGEQGVRPLTEADRQRLLAQEEELAGQALRVLALAYRPLRPGEATQEVEGLERGLIWLGLVGMIDPPRPEVKEAVVAAERAGIKTIMITGDHPATALAIGQELGLVSEADGAVLTGAELERLSEADLSELAGRVRVYARVSPEHKLRIVRAIKGRGEVVAMTGDGVNDAPAVKEADIGVAMGLTGTDVTREASHMVLADDNYATIVAAVEEGRAIYDNIRKFIRYLLSCNTGEILVMFLATLFGLPLPLLPIQILWVNLVTDGLPAMALSVDPADPDIMVRPPRHPQEGVFSRGLGGVILWRGALIGLSTLAVFVYGYLYGPHADPLAYGRTLAFATLVCAQLIHVFDCRSERRPLTEIGLFSNPWLLGAVAVSFTMLLAVIYLPTLTGLFGTVSLSGPDWALVFLASAIGQVVTALGRLLAGGRPEAAPQLVD